jgi:branched-chain amino acid transport system permease protein
MFCGIAGGLQVMGNESANYASFDAGVSASVVLNSYIGGVGTFLGPALGAALMTFFGYAVSDATQAWLLYQGVLFVLVMMFMPDGLTGLFTATGRLLRRHGIAAVLPLAAMSILAALLLSAGVMFIVELLQRLFSQDHRSLARMSASAVPVMLFGRAWFATALSTWFVPAGLLATGALMAWAVRRAHRDLARAASHDGPAPAVGSSTEVAQ